MRYSCVYWVDHLCHSVSGMNTTRDDLLHDDRVVHTFLKTKYLYWLEALSLLRAMSEGIIAIRQLEGLLVSMAGPRMRFTISPKRSGLRLRAILHMYTVHCKFQRTCQLPIVVPEQQSGRVQIPDLAACNLAEPPGPLLPAIGSES